MPPNIKTSQSVPESVPENILKFIGKLQGDFLPSVKLSLRELTYILTLGENSLKWADFRRSDQITSKNTIYRTIEKLKRDGLASYIGPYHCREYYLTGKGQQVYYSFLAWLHSSGFSLPDSIGD
jgi:hypothetical protein